ncbi:MAG: transglycosylase domain-containing protein, partial [Acidimicrobiia bacterium]
MARKALIHQVEARERRGRWFGALATLLSISLLLSGWVGLFAFLGADTAFGTFEEVTEEWVPDTRSLELTLPDLSRVSRIYAASGEVLAELHDGRNSEPVPYDEVPEVVVNAILAAEDSDFFQHEGIDFSAILSAAIDNIIYDTTRGGSTITQQVVKNAFVGNELTIRRKVNEAFISAELERRFSKERILEFYMNSVYFGAGAYGIKAAAEEFYGKELDDLTVDQAATLAVLVRNPSLYNPRRRPEVTLERRNKVIAQMAEEGWITEAQAEYFSQRPLGVVDSPLRRGEADHVVAEVKKELLNSPEFAFLGKTIDERKRVIFGCPADDVACEGGGGLQIFTTIDLKLQKEANRILQRWLPLLPYEQNLEACKEIFPDFDDKPEFYARYAEIHSCTPTGAITMVENGTGAVRVMASGLPFDFSQFDLAVQGRRNPGSAFKPFALTTALSQGHSLNEYWSGKSPIEIECPFICSPDGTNIWKVKNAGSSLGVIPLEMATYRSVNAVYAQVSLAVGPENIVRMAQKMGIESPLEPVLSIPLGSSAVSTLEMASAYSNFATNGAHAEAYIIDKIVDKDGNVIYQHDAEPPQVADPAIFAAVRRALLKVPAIGTAAKVFNKRLPDGTRPYQYMVGRVGGKTGTHQSYLDAWFVGFSPEYSAAVWVGYEAQQIPLENVVIRGDLNQKVSRIFGATVPAPIWAEFMDIVLKDLPETDFPPEPPNIRNYLVRPTTFVPPVVGLTQEEAEDRLALEARLNVAVIEVASVEPAGTVVYQTPEPGEELKQGETVTVYLSTGEMPVGNLPNLVGLTFEQAQTRAQEFQLATGVKLTLVQETVEVTDPNLVGKIVTTNPAPGTQITDSATVVVSIG